MRLVYFTHSLRSCWNHGNAHFLRGVLGEFASRGHDVAAYEPRGAWSLDNLLRDHGEEGLDAYRQAYPGLNSTTYGDDIDLDQAIGGADVVIVHEWNDPWLVAAIGAHRAHGGTYQLFFHDTHHRAVSDPVAMQAYALDGYDAVLAFGETLAEVYRGWGWGERVRVWHEAADTRVFRPPSPSPEPGDTSAKGLVWIGNWGDDERSQELEAYLFQPSQRLGLPLDTHGVRYPESARATLARYGASYRGWAPNAAAPAIFARHLATAHIPRRFYVDALPGIPTIRVFEALACGIPLVSAPWHDTEGLFRVGTDFLMAEDPAEMEQHLAAVRDDLDLRASLAAHGLATIRARHTCAHRVDELLAFTARLGAGRTLETSA